MILPAGPHSKWVPPLWTTKGETPILSYLKTESNDVLTHYQLLAVRRDVNALRSRLARQAQTAEGVAI